MNRSNDGGPAFPRGPDTVGRSHDGMSLRDWFAGQALAGMGLWLPEHGGDNLAAKRAMQARALWAYEQADAMLAEKKRTEKWGE